MSPNAVLGSTMEASRTACPAGGRETITGFTRYSQAIPARERKKVEAIAAAIRASHRPGCRPIVAVRLEGHADRDPAREARQPGFEKRVSAERARRVAAAVRTRLGPRLAKRVRFDIVAAGSTARVVAKPVNEEQRARNRRVEVSFTPSPVKQPGPPPPPPPACGGLPPFPRPRDIDALLVLVGRALRAVPGLPGTGVKAPTAVRFLFLDEQRVASPIFKRSLDYSTIMISDGLGAGTLRRGRPVTLAIPTRSGFVVVMNLGTTACQATGSGRSTLIHELVHAWQSQHHPSATAFMRNSAKCQALAFADEPIAKAAAAAAATAAAMASGVRDPRAIAAAARTAAAREESSAYAYVPGKPFGDYAAEQIAQQVEHEFEGTGRPTPSIVPLIKRAAPRTPVPENVSSLAVTSFHRKSTPHVVFP